MKVQTRLSLFCSIVFGVVYGIISVLIFMLYWNYTERSIYDSLKKTSYITALFYLEEDELNKDEFAKVKDQFDEFVPNSDYQIYNEKNEVSYGLHLLNVSSTILEKAREERFYSFTDDEFFCYAIFYEDNQGDFVVVARERRETLTQQMNLLLIILLPAFIIGILAIVLLSRWVAYIAYQPFRQVIKEVNNISTNNLDVQIASSQTKDELQDLIETFNQLLSKLSETFVIQKNFIRYVSHEFKTPLTSMLGNLEVHLTKERSTKEYEDLSQKLIQQIHQLENTLNTLLIVSDLQEGANVSTQVRVDELIWQIIERVSVYYGNTKIVVEIDIIPQDEELLSVSTDKTQLLIALYNLIENAVKYSQGGSVDIRLFGNEKRLSLSIHDNGIGITADKLENISKPFHRGKNTNRIEGSGIGLSIALRILEKNQIEYTIESEVGVGTMVVLLFV